MRIRNVLFVSGLLLFAGVAFAGELTIGKAIGRVQPADLDRPGRVMQVPYYLDGLLFPAGHPLPDRALVFVLGRAGADGVRPVHAFSSRDVADEFMRREKAARALKNEGERFAAEANFDCTWTAEYSWFNKNVGCGGSDTLTLYYPNSYDDLDFGGWNNTISCVRAACNGYYTALYACRNFATSEGYDCDDADYWFVPSGDIITDLNAYGMNNRTSSIQFVP